MLLKPPRYLWISVYTMAHPGPMTVCVLHKQPPACMSRTHEAWGGNAPHALLGYPHWLPPLLPSHPPPVWLDEGFTEGFSATTDELSPPAAAICCPSIFLAFLTFVFFALSTFPRCERRLPPGPCKNTAKVMCPLLPTKKLLWFPYRLVG